MFIFRFVSIKPFFLGYRKFNIWPWKFKVKVKRNPVMSFSGLMYKWTWCMLTHWGRVTHICFSRLTIIGSYNGLSPDRHQAIIWTNAGILLIGPLGTNFSEILIEILTFSFEKMRLKVSSAKRRPFCLGLNVLKLLYFLFNFPWRGCLF